MHRRSPHQISISWEVTTLDVTTGGFLAFDCQKCQSPLDVHQPDEDHPVQLLGTCRNCGAWHLIEVAPDGSEAILLKMPSVEYVREKLAESGESTQPHRRGEKNLGSLLHLGSDGHFC